MIELPQNAPQDTSAGTRRWTPPRRRWSWHIGVVLLTLITIAASELYSGNNCWRVRYHHGVRLPASVREIHCWGTTAFPVLEGHSNARFVIDAADLPQFLSQFKEGVTVQAPDGSSEVVAKPNAPPLAPEGDTWGPSPTGTDFYGLKWRTTKSGVAIELDTDWN